MIRKRHEVPEEDQWDLRSFYATEEDWHKRLAEWMQEVKPETWETIKPLQGTLIQGPTAIKKTLETILSIRRKLESLYVYAHLRHDENTADDTWAGHYKRVSNLFQDFGTAVSWFDPELLALPENKLEEALKSPELAEYHIYLSKIVRMRPHTLSKQEEQLLAQSSKALQTSRRGFSAFQNSDITFPPAKDSAGKEHELTHSSFSLYLYSPDRVLRESAFKNYMGTYSRYAHTLCELLAGNAEKNAFLARARGFSSSLEAALYPHHIDTAVYHSLISAVRDNLKTMHDYMQLRKEMLGLDELHPYDLYISPVHECEVEIPYDVGKELVIESVAPLGKEYQKILQNGLNQARWVDRYENRNKRSGAYSSGCYDSVPYILMNYKHLARDVSTLAHEAGHSMHSYLSMRKQSYHDADYPIFVAEVASTFNEELLADLMMKRAKTAEEKIFYVHEQIEKIRGTLFRQTLFAEFELFLHLSIEKNKPLTPQLIQAHYMQLVKDYYGPAVVLDQELSAEWSRIPHFYSSFYVYQYATGLSAAIALADLVKSEKPGARERYLTFLQSGGSRYPLDLLESAGVDMRSPEPVNLAMKRFKELVNELRRLLQQRSSS